MNELTGRVALVTGASRGVGRGVAIGLAHARARVCATGRTVAGAAWDAGVTAIPCDHADDYAVAQVFERITREAGRLDVLVNSAWGGIAAALAAEYGFTDVDGRQPRALTLQDV